jgi:hypothetical protein
MGVKNWVLFYSFCVFFQPIHADTTQNLLQLHNKYRELKGVPPLCVSPKLTHAAESFCHYMADTDDFAHRSRNGNNVVNRAEQSGYQWKSLGENIGVGYQQESKVMNAWINSPTHEINIKNPVFTQVGFARCQAVENKPYWVALFGASTTEPCMATDSAMTATDGHEAVSCKAINLQQQTIDGDSLAVILEKMQPSDQHTEDAAHNKFSITHNITYQRLPESNQSIQYYQLFNEQKLCFKRLNTNTWRCKTKQDTIGVARCMRVSF